MPSKKGKESMPSKKGKASSGSSRKGSRSRKASSRAESPASVSRSRSSSSKRSIHAARSPARTVATVNTPRRRDGSGDVIVERPETPEPTKPQQPLKAVSSSDKTRNDDTYFYLKWAIKVLDHYRNDIAIGFLKPLVDKLNKADPGGHKEQKSLRLKLQVVQSNTTDVFRDSKDANDGQFSSMENINSTATRHRPQVRLKPTCLYEMAINWRLHKLLSVTESCVPLMKQLATYLEKVEHKYYGDLNIHKHVMGIFNATRALAFIFDLEVVSDEKKDGAKLVQMRSELPKPPKEFDASRPASTALLNAYQIRINHMKYYVVTKIVDCLKGSFEFIRTKELQKEHLGGTAKSAIDHLAVEQLKLAPKFRLVGNIVSVAKIDALLK